MENEPFEDVFPWGYSIAMLVYWRVYGYDLSTVSKVSTLVYPICIDKNWNNSVLQIFRLGGSLYISAEFSFPGPAAVDFKV